jgi:hypothetical protein
MKPILTYLQMGTLIGLVRITITRKKREMAGFKVGMTSDEGTREREGMYAPSMPDIILILRQGLFS